MIEHSFRDSLQGSHTAEDLPFWREAYQKLFPTMVAMINHRQDGEHQRAGIDRSIVLANSKQILVDEKVRWRAYDDILLEYLSDAERKAPGWVCRPLRADYIAYAVAPLGKCYLLPVVQLQLAWTKHGETWKQSYSPVVARSRDGERTWTTQSVAVPVCVLFPAILGALQAEFKPIENPGSVTTTDRPPGLSTTWP